MVTDQAPASASQTLAQRMNEDGFVGPVRLLTRDQCALIARHFRYDRMREGGEWWKDWAAVDPFYHKLAMRPVLLDLLKPVLGPDIVLWGCSVLERQPGQVHPWHTDIESAAPEGGFASIWIGLENTSVESSLHVIAGSHRYGKTIQEIRHHKGVAKRGDMTDAMVLDWAMEFDPEAKVSVPEVTDGMGILFDGRLWHGTNNQRTEGTRMALLLQYAAGDAPVYRYDSKQVDFPFHFDRENRPAVVAVSGTPDPSRNRVVAPPTYRRRHAWPIVSETHRLKTPLKPAPGQPWTPHRVFKGPTANVEFQNVHASVLLPGHMPHPPHAHVEEEILVVLDGRGEILLGEGPDPEKARRVPVEPGSFTYYPAYQFHTIRNSGPGPLSYLMFKWNGTPYEVEGALPMQVVHGAEIEPEPKPEKRYAAKHLFKGPTGYLGRLKAHISVMDPGGGYPVHEDKHDVAIVVLSGELMANEEKVEPHTLLYYSGGTPHGLRNTGNRPAKYLVFEFENESGPGDPRQMKIAGLEPKPAKRTKTPAEKMKKRLKKALRIFSGGGRK